MPDSQSISFNGTKKPGTASGTRWIAYKGAKTLGQLRKLNETNYTQGAIWDAERGLL